MVGARLRTFLVCTLGLVLAQGACATATEAPPEDPPIEPTTDSATPPADATPDRGKDTAVPPEAAPPDTSRPDTSTDARPDVDGDAGAACTPQPFDPLGPKTGAACPSGTPTFGLLERRCGKCGTQKAFCEPGDGGNVVGEFGPCSGEKTGADTCVPGSCEGLACGNCGTQQRRCDLACLWVVGACAGEVPGGCTANEVKHLDGLCPNPSDVRKQVCSATCTPGMPSPCGPQEPDEIVASQVAGAVVTGLFNTTPTTRTIQRLSAGTCPATLSSTLTTYHWTRVTNPGPEALNVSVSNVVPPGQAKLDVIMAAYAGAATPPLATRTACTGSVVDTPETVTFNVDAGGSAIVYTGCAATAKAGRILLEAKTNYVGPEPRPAVDYTVLVSETSGDTVTEAITFDTTKQTTTLATGACPRNPTTTNRPNKYIAVTNPNPTDVVLDLSLATGLTTMMAAYRLPGPPISTERSACDGTVNSSCGTAVPGSASCLTSVPLAAGETIYVLALMNTTATSGGTTFRATTQ